MTVIPASRIKPPSIPISPNSFSMSTNFSSFKDSFNNFLISVVLPAPKNPEIISTFAILLTPFLTISHYIIFLKKRSKYDKKAI